MSTTVSIRLRRFPTGTRSNDRNFVRIVHGSIGKTPNASSAARASSSAAPHYVLKLSSNAAPGCEHEGLVYEDVASDEHVVDCAFHGRVRIEEYVPTTTTTMTTRTASSSSSSVPGLRLLGIRIDYDDDGRPVPTTTTTGDTSDGGRTWVLSPKDSGPLSEYLGWKRARTDPTYANPRPRSTTVYVVLTRYSASRISLYHHVSVKSGTPPTSEFTQGAYDALVDLHRRFGFVHWDFHHHNQIIRLDTAPRSWGVVDLDLSTTRTHPTSRILDLLPVDEFVLAARRWVGRGAADRFTTTVLGHAYDVVLLLSSHDYLRRGAVFVPTTPDSRRVYRNYELARTILGTEEGRYGKLVRRLARRHLRRQRVRSSRRVERSVKSMQKHLRLLCRAALLAALHTLNVDYTELEDRFRRDCDVAANASAAASSSSSSSSGTPYNRRGRSTSTHRRCRSAQ